MSPGRGLSRGSAHLFLQLQGACLVEQQVVVSSNTEEQAGSAGQGAVGQLPPGAWQLRLGVHTLPRGCLPHAQHACAGTGAAGTHRSVGLPQPLLPALTHLGRQLSGSAGLWTSHPAQALAPLAMSLRPPRSKDERVRGGSLILPRPPHWPWPPGFPTSNTGTVFVAWQLCRSQTMQILSRPELGEIATSVPGSSCGPPLPAEAWVAGH